MHILETVDLLFSCPVVSRAQNDAKTVSDDSSAGGNEMRA